MSGHNKNNNKYIHKYRLKPNQLPQVKSLLLSLKKRNFETLKKLKEDLTQRLNTLPDSTRTLSHKSGFLSEELPTLDFDYFLNSILNHDLANIQTINPYLNQEDFEELLSLSYDILLIESQNTQICQAEELIRKIERGSQSLEQDLGEIIDHQRHYDPLQYPEFLIYEYKSKKLLRAQQVGVLINLIEAFEVKNELRNTHTQALLQFPAGGGKTSVIIPILTQYFARKGLLPVIFNTNELYDIGKDEIPFSLLKAFNQGVEVIERDLNHQWSNEELVLLLSELELWRREKKALLIKPSTWHSINTTMKLAYAHGDIELGKSCANVLSFFKTKAIQLQDETHLISSPLQESIRTYGPQAVIETKQRLLILEVYQYLFDKNRCDSSISSIIDLSSSDKESICPDQLNTIKEALSRFFTNHTLFQSINSTNLSMYLLQEDNLRPEWLVNIRKDNKELADLVVLARSFIQLHFPHSLRLQIDKDYGRSIHKNDFTVAPKHDGQDVSSHFADPLLVLVLTTQMYFMKGLNELQVEIALEYLIHQHQKEKKFFGPSTPAQQTLQNILSTHNLHLDQLSLKDVPIFAATQKLAHNNKLIQYFLKTNVYPQITKPLNQVKSTPAELQAGLRGILFSATPGLSETYPAFIEDENIFLTEDFEAEVIESLNSQRNSEHCFIDLTQSVDEFFSQFIEKCPDLFSSATALIDRGGLLINKPNAEIIDSLIKIANGDKNKLNVLFFDEQQLNVLLTEKKETLVKVLGTRVHETLKTQGIEPHQVMLFMFLALSRTTGTDIKRPLDDKAILTLGKEQTLTETIQAAMRERQLLKENGQQVAWLVFKELYEQIDPGFDEFNTDVVIEWLIKNEAEQTKHKILTRAYQGIDEVVESYLWNEINANRLFYNNYKEALEPKLTLDVYNNYQLESTEQKTNFALNEYFLKVRSRFNLKSTQLPQNRLIRVENIIRQTMSLIESISSQISSINQEVEQELELQTFDEQESELETQSHYDKSQFSLIKHESFSKEDTLTNVFKNISHGHQVIPFVTDNCLGLKVPTFYLDWDRFSPVPTEGSDHHWLKPIRKFLVQITSESKILAVAITEIGAKYYWQKIIDYENNQTGMQYAIIAIDGEVVISTQNFKLNNTLEVALNQFTSHLTTFARLLNGEIVNSVKVQELILFYQWTENDVKCLSQFVENHSVSKHSNQLLSLHDTFELYQKSTMKDHQESNGLMSSMKFEKEEITVSNKSLQPTFFSAIPEIYEDLSSEAIHFIEPIEELIPDLTAPQEYPDIPESSTTLPQEDLFNTEYEGTQQSCTIYQDRLSGKHLICQGERYTVYLTPKETSTPLLTAGEDVPLENSSPPGDTFDKKSCYPTNHYGQDVVSCEGIEYELIYTPKEKLDVQRYVSGSTNQLALATTLYQMGKSFYSWFFEEHPPVVYLERETAQEQLRGIRVTIDEIEPLLDENENCQSSFDLYKRDFENLEYRLTHSTKLEKKELEKLNEGVYHLKQSLTKLSENECLKVRSKFKTSLIAETDINVSDFMFLDKVFANPIKSLPLAIEQKVTQLCEKYNLKLETLLALVDHWQRINHLNTEARTIYHSDLTNLRDTHNDLITNFKNGGSLQAGKFFRDKLPSRTNKRTVSFPFWGNVSQTNKIYANSAQKLLPNTKLLELLLR